MEGYSVKILETNKELTARERIILKDTSNATKIDEATVEGKLVLTPITYAVLGVHNEKSDNKDYEVYLIENADGTKFVTGSQSFWNSFKAIYDEMVDEEVGSWSVECFRLPSKNFKGKEFLTCSLI